MLLPVIVMGGEKVYWSISLVAWGKELKHLIIPPLVVWQPMATLNTLPHHLLTQVGSVSASKYAADLLCLDACRHKLEHRNKLPLPKLPYHCTYVRGDWVKSLASHPEQAFANYICTGLKEGFQG